MIVCAKDQCDWVRDDGPGCTKMCMLPKGHVGAHVDCDAIDHRWMLPPEWRRFDQDRQLLMQERDDVMAQRDELNERLREILAALERK